MIGLLSRGSPAAARRARASGAREWGWPTSKSICCSLIELRMSPGARWTFDTHLRHGMPPSRFSIETSPIPPRLCVGVYSPRRRPREQRLPWRNQRHVSSYEMDTEGSGGRRTERGRATEVFVRQRGRWLNTGWQLAPVPSRQALHAPSSGVRGNTHAQQTRRAAFERAAPLSVCQIIQSAAPPRGRGAMHDAQVAGRHRRHHDDRGG